MIAAALAAVLIGSVSGARALSGLFSVGDIRGVGSGNAGASNAWRAGGPGYGLAVLAFDILKGAVAVGLAAAIAPLMPWPAVCAGLAVVGHVWPVWHGFRGGKGLATSAGVLIFLAPLTLVAATGVYALVLAWRRIASLAGLAAVGTAWLGALFVPAMPASVRVLIGLLGVLLVITHRENIVRLRFGEEPRVDNETHHG
tara:strand:+ start:17511 stop:18107 length:597 start_codon:yes stop_codon:yes gene_type:complete